MKVRWTEQAAARLEAIEAVVARNDPRAAEELVENLIERGESLKAHPKRGRVVPEIRNPEIRELIIRGYRLVYRVSDKAVDVLTVFEGHRQLRTDELG